MLYYILRKQLCETILYQDLYNVFTTLKLYEFCSKEAIWADTNESNANQQDSEDIQASYDSKSVSWTESSAFTEN